MLGSHANRLESLINLSVSVIILLFSVKSKLSSPYNTVHRVKGAMCPISFNDASTRKPHILAKVCHIMYDQTFALNLLKNKQKLLLIII